jgi:hypothetical protein
MLGKFGDLATVAFSKHAAKPSGSGLADRSPVEGERRRADSR